MPLGISVVAIWPYVNHKYTMPSASTHAVSQSYSLYGVAIVCWPLAF